MVWLFLVGCGAPDPEPVVVEEQPVRTVTAPPARAPRGSRSDGEGGPLRIEGVSLAPQPATAADTLHATVDLAGVTGAPPILDFSWYVDGAIVDGAISDTLRAGKASRAQKVHAEVTVVGTNPPVTGRSPEITIANRPPVMLTDPGNIGGLDGMMVKAEDPDGEPLSWRLEGAPAGMSVDQRGIVRYTGTADEKGGTYTVKVIAEDTGHDFVVLQLPVTLTPGSAAVRAEAEKKKKAEEAAKAAADAAAAAKAK